MTNPNPDRSPNPNCNHLIHRCNFQRFYHPYNRRISLHLNQAENLKPFQPDFHHSAHHPRPRNVPLISQHFIHRVSRLLNHPLSLLNLLHFFPQKFRVGYQLSSRLIVHQNNLCQVHLDFPYHNQADSLVYNQ